MFKFETAPALSKDHKVRELAPQPLTKLHKEGVCMLFHTICVPVAIILISDHDFAIHYLLSCVRRLTVYVNSS